jgi:hypothetical protein
MTRSKQRIWDAVLRDLSCHLAIDRVERLLHAATRQGDERRAVGFPLVKSPGRLYRVDADWIRRMPPMLYRR